MFEKILVCTDLSPASDALIQCSIEELKRAGTEEVVLAHVTRGERSGAPETLTMQAQIILERQVRVLRENNLRAVVDLPDGPPARALAGAAARHDVSVILVCSHGRGVIEGALLGSVSLQLLHQADRPVLLVPLTLFEEGKVSSVCPSLFARILLPTDFSETAEKVLRHVGSLAQSTGAAVTLLHVMEEEESGDGSPPPEETAQYLLAAKKRRLEKGGAVEVTTALVPGDPQERIAAYAQEGNFSLVAMGFKGKALVKEVFTRNLALEVTRHATMPVLCIPVAD